MAVMRVCFQRRRVHHNANYVPYVQMPVCHVRNLHCNIHVAAENKHSLPPFGSLASLDCNGVFVINVYSFLHCLVSKICNHIYSAGTVYRVSSEPSSVSWCCSASHPRSTSSLPSTTTMLGSTALSCRGNLD